MPKWSDMAAMAELHRQAYPTAVRSFDRTHLNANRNPTTETKGTCQGRSLFEIWLRGYATATPPRPCRSPACHARGEALPAAMAGRRARRKLLRRRHDRAGAGLFLFRRQSATPLGDEAAVARRGAAHGGQF